MSESQVRRYVPRATGLHRDFFIACVEGGLHLQRCGDCGHWQHPPRYYCGECRSKALSFQPASGRGTVYSFAVSHFTHDPGWAADAPFGTVVVATEEGPRIVATWQAELETLCADAPVRIAVEPVNEAFGLIEARPSGG